MLDASLWTPNFHGLFIAQDLDTAKDIFSNKIELAWKNYPLQKLYKVDTQSARQLKFDYGDGSVSSITIDSSGRSGTYNRVHITEFADVAKRFPDKAREIIEGTIPAVPSDGDVTIESTAQGAAGMFYDMFWEAYNRPMSDRIRPIEYKAHFFNWQYDDAELALISPETVPPEFEDYRTLHKLSDREITYYYHRFLSLGKSWNALKREYPTTVEEAFEAIIEGVIYAEEIALARKENRIGRVAWDASIPVYTVWDFGKGTNLAVGFFQKYPNELRWIDAEEGSLGDAMPQMIKKVKEKPYVYAKHFAPHDAYVAEIGTGKSRVDTALSLGFKFEGDKDHHAIPEVSVQDGIDRARMLWLRLSIDSVRCAGAINALSNYQHEWDERRGMWKDTPFHNWSSHFGDVLRYTALVEDKMTTVEARPWVDSYKEGAQKPGVTIYG